MVCIQGWPSKGLEGLGPHLSLLIYKIHIMTTWITIWRCFPKADYILGHPKNICNCRTKTHFLPVNLMLIWNDTAMCVRLILHSICVTTLLNTSWKYFHQHWETFTGVWVKYKHSVTVFCSKQQTLFYFERDF